MGLVTVEEYQQHFEALEKEIDRLNEMIHFKNDEIYNWSVKYEKMEARAVDAEAELEKLRSE